MSTRDVVDVKKVKSKVSEVQAAAVSLMSGMSVIKPDLDELYENAKEQPAVIISDTSMSELSFFKNKTKKVLVSYSGEDCTTSTWAHRVLPSKEEACCCEECREFREKYLKIVREASYDLMQREMIKTEVIYGGTKSFSGKLQYLVPREFAKLAFDLNVNFMPAIKDVLKDYDKSDEIDADAIRIISYPDWVNDEWMYWKSRNSKDSDGDDPEPPRILMIFDPEFNTAFLLGGRYYGENRAAALTLMWNTAIEAGVGLPVNGASKTITASKGSKKQQATFLTLDTDSPQAAMLGITDHGKYLVNKKGESVSIDSAGSTLLMLKPASKKKSLFSLENNFYMLSGSDDVPFPYEKSVVSGENIMVMENDKEEKKIVCRNFLNENGRVIVSRKGTGEESAEFPTPDYIAIPMKDDLMPPIVLLKDPDLIAASYFSYVTKDIEENMLDFIPGANPYSIWSLEKELEMLGEIIEGSKLKALMLNYGSFFSSANNVNPISMDAMLALYPKITRGEMKWKEWKQVPGFFLPDKGSFKGVVKDFDNSFDPAKVGDPDLYMMRLKARFEQKVDLLKKINMPYSLVMPFMKILEKIS